MKHRYTSADIALNILSWQQGAEKYFFTIIMPEALNEGLSALLGFYLSKNVSTSKSHPSSGMLPYTSSIGSPPIALLVEEK